METIENYFEQSLLSLAAYASNLQRGMFGENDTNYIAALKNDGAGMSDVQARKFAKNYTVVDQRGNRCQRPILSNMLFC